MSGVKPVAIPLVTDGNLTLHSGTTRTNCTKYRTLIGSLQYLYLTHPDLSYVVNKLSQFMHLPTSEHWNAAKRLLRYLCVTLTHGLFLHKANTLFPSCLLRCRLGWKQRWLYLYECLYCLSWSSSNFLVIQETMYSCLVIHRGWVLINCRYYFRNQLDLFPSHIAWRHSTYTTCYLLWQCWCHLSSF